MTTHQDALVKQLDKLVDGITDRERRLQEMKRRQADLEKVTQQLEVMTIKLNQMEKVSRRPAG